MPSARAQRHRRQASPEQGEESANAGQRMSVLSPTDVMRFTRETARNFGIASSKMMRAERDQQNDGDWNANQPKQDGAHRDNLPVTRSEGVNESAAKRFPRQRAASWLMSAFNGRRTLETTG